MSIPPISRSVSVNSHPSRSVSTTGIQPESSMVVPLSDKARQIEAIFQSLNMNFRLARINQPSDFQHTIFTHYDRWCNYNLATITYNAMRDAQTWSLQPLNKVALINLFASPSSFYESIETPFTTISTNPEYSEMKTWLETKGKNPPALQVWGMPANSYTIADLKKWISQGGTLDPNPKKIKKQGKSKEKSHKKGSTSQIK